MCWSIEHDFRKLCEELSSSGHPNLQQTLKELEVEDVPEQYQSAFSFWKSLGGRSRNLMFMNAIDRWTKKRW
jgi:hypothetical protein